MWWHPLRTGYFSGLCKIFLPEAKTGASSPQQRPEMFQSWTVFFEPPLWVPQPKESVSQSSKGIGGDKHPRDSFPKTPKRKRLQTSTYWCTHGWARMGLCHLDLQRTHSNAWPTIPFLTKNFVVTPRSAEVVQTTKDYLAKCVVFSINVCQSCTAEESNHSWVREAMCSFLYPTGQYHYRLGT